MPAEHVLAIHAEWELIPNQLYLLAARVAPTPRGTLGMSWVMRNQVDTFMPAAAIAAPDFHDRLVELLGGDRFVAGISCHDKLHVVRADSGWLGDLEQMVFAADHLEEDLVPTLLAIEPGGIRIIKQNGTPLM
ncbi:hypothetical protein [Nocardia sp. NPDC057030]|uniref:hypothetical protein n=1 Tax=unclassified Nocardia TaxID=2637762 RepID=UPI00362EE13A